MVRLILKDGVFVPVDPLPANWQNGYEVGIDADDVAEPDIDINAWLREMNELCADSTPADEAHIRAVLAEQRRLGKERMRRPVRLD